jgi:hypothetical protein
MPASPAPYLLHPAFLAYLNSLCYLASLSTILLSLRTYSDPYRRRCVLWLEMELSTIRRNNKTFRVFEKKKESSVETARRGRDSRLSSSSASSALSPRLTLIVFIAISAFITFSLFAFMNSKPIDAVEYIESENQVPPKKRKKGDRERWTVPISSHCQHVKYSLMFCDSNGVCCSISQTNLSSGCCLASSSPSSLHMAVGSPQFHEGEKAWESEQITAITSSSSPRYSCHQCDEESSCCNEYHSCLSCCQHPSHVELTHSLHLKESHYASFALKHVSDFEWCSFICRPSSISLSETENSYRSPLNYCFLSHGPPVVFTSINSDRQRPPLSPLVRSDQKESNQQPKYRYLRSVILHDKKTSTHERHRQ